MWITARGVALLPFYLRRLPCYLREDYAQMRRAKRGRIASARYAISTAHELAGMMLKRKAEPPTLESIARRREGR